MRNSYKLGFDDPSQLRNQTMPYLVKDAESALVALHDRFPEAQLGIVGFSEGALVAAMAAAEYPVDFLHLLSLPTRSIDESLSYEFVEWPVDLLKRKLKVAANGDLIPEDSFPLPLLGADWKTIDFGKSGTLSVANELVLNYLKYYSNVLELLKTQAFAPWYNALKVSTPFSKVAKEVSATVYIYEPMENAQNDWGWVVADQTMFTANGGKTTLRLFPGLGHCFAPMEGELGQIKTSGPLSQGFLETFEQDLNN